MCRFMNDVVQALKTALNSELSEAKTVVALSENDLVNTLEVDVILLSPSKCSKGKNYPGYHVCSYEIIAAVEVVVKKRENAVKKISDVVRNVCECLNQLALNIERAGFIAMKDVRCKVIDYPNKNNPVKNKLRCKVLTIVETFEELEVS